MSDTPEPRPFVNTRKTRFEDRSVSFKSVVFALPFIAAAAVTFATFVISQANAQGMGAVKIAEAVRDDLKALKTQMEAKDAGQREDVRLLRADMERRQSTVESKVDRVDAKIGLVLDELRRQRR